MPRKRRRPTYFGKKVRIDELDPASAAKIKDCMEVIKKNWPKEAGSNIRNATVFNTEDLRLFHTTNGKIAYGTTILKKRVAHLPAFAWRLITPARRGKMPTSLKNPILHLTTPGKYAKRDRQITIEIHKGAGITRIPKKALVKLLNIDAGGKSKIRGPAARLIFFPENAVEEIFTIERIKRALDAGIKEKTLVYWTKKPQYIKQQIKKIKELEKEQKS